MYLGHNTREQNSNNHLAPCKDSTYQLDNNHTLTSLYQSIYLYRRHNTMHDSIPCRGYIDRSDNTNTMHWNIYPSRGCSDRYYSCSSDGWKRRSVHEGSSSTSLNEPCPRPTNGQWGTNGSRRRTTNDEEDRRKRTCRFRTLLHGSTTSSSNGSRTR